MRLIEDLLPFDCAKAESRSMPIDTVVIHFISAINWDKQADEEKQSLIALGLPEVPPRERKLHPAYCRALLIKAKLSYHYLVCRDGTVVRLVDEGRVAWHAGASRMPTDGREWVNSFSVGISLIACHPDDDPAVASGEEPGFTQAQYDALGELLADLRSRHAITALVGHDEIAPGRKKDPGPLFEWVRFRKDGHACL